MYHDSKLFLGIKKDKMVNKCKVMNKYQKIEENVFRQLKALRVQVQKLTMS